LKVKEQISNARTGMILEINNTHNHNTETMNKELSKPIVECKVNS
jgi:hypothetical protein